jgi:hypothetical protein
MRKRTTILFTIVLGLLVRPLQLPAASCILSNAPSEKPCKMHCCANKTCCAKSKGTSGPVSQPLHQSVDAKQQQMLAIVSVLVIDSIPVAVSPQPARENFAMRAHSPPPLAATCIRLI